MNLRAYRPDNKWLYAFFTTEEKKTLKLTNLLWLTFSALVLVGCQASGETTTEPSAIGTEPLVTQCAFQGEKRATPAHLAELDSRAKVERMVEAWPKRDALWEVQRRYGKAQIIVEVLITETGSVEDPRIVECYVGAPGSRRRVLGIGYGLEEAALAAAPRWIFYPAYKDGKPARSYHEIAFGFGV